MIDFRVLGSLDLRGPEGEEILSVLSQPKRVALLSYLAVAAPRGYHRRDKLVGLFWPELGQDRARAALRKSLHHLRQSLGETAVLSRGDDDVSLNWDEFRCDAEEFKRSVKGDPENALELYRGDLLEGFFLSNCPEFDRWMDGERDGLRVTAAEAAWGVAHKLLRAGRINDGERAAQRALALTPTDESEVRRFIEALAAAGDRAGAVQFYGRFAEGLEEELDLRPAAETRAVVDEIRASRIAPVPGGDPSEVSGRGGGVDSHPLKSPEVPSEPRSTETAPVPLFERVKAALANRYSLEREIGSGGMATVFLAEDLRHRRKVAVKVLRPELAQALGAKRFLREIEVAANLTHPHILSVHDSGEADKLLFYVMPYVDGGSLRERLAKEEQLPVEAALSIAREIADALTFAHERGVIHRDVKPANILLTGGHALLADFGVAQAVAEAKGTRLTQRGMSVGTPSYMSPEQVTGERELDGRSDQYALGCVLFEMLAGQPPFTGPSGESISRQHLTADPPQVTHIRPTVPEEVTAALKRSLAKAKADRFPSAAEFGGALAAHVPTPPNGIAGAVGVRPRRTWQRLPTPAVVGFGIVGAVAIAAAAYLWFPRGGGALPGSPAYHRVAVLPPQNQTGDPSLDRIGLQAADFISDGLARAELGPLVVPIQDIVAAGRAASAETGGWPDLSRTWPQDTGAEIAVLGAFYAVGDSLQFRFRIVDRDGVLLTSVDPVTGPASEPSRILPGLQTRVLGAFAGVVSPGHDLALATRGGHPPNPDALAAMLEGMALHYETNWEAAISNFQRAADLDPDYLVPLKWLMVEYLNVGPLHKADSLCVLLEGRFDELTQEQRLETQATCAGVRGDNLAALGFAEQLTEFSPFAWYNVGFLNLGLNRPRAAVEAFSKWDEEWGRRSREWAKVNLLMWARALHILGEHESELEIVQRGREMGPEFPQLIVAEINALIGLGRFEEAELLIEERRSNLLPGQNPYTVLTPPALEFEAHGQPQRAQRLWEQLDDWHSSRPLEEVETPISELYRAFFLVSQKRIEEARALAESAVEEAGPGFADYGTFLLGLFGAMTGNRPEAERYSEILRRKALGMPLRDSERRTFWRGLISANLGDFDEAIDLLEQAMEEGWRIWQRHPHTEQFLQPMWGYPPFEEFVRPKG